MLALLTAQEEAPRPFIYSARGPGESRGVLAIGGRAFAIVPTASGDGPTPPLPMFDGAYAYGLSDRLALTVDLTTIVLFNSGSLGLQYRLIGGPDSTFSLAFNASLTGYAATALVASFAGAGLRPGLVASVGDENVQFSLSLALPIYLVGASSVIDDPGNATSSRPFADLMPNIYATLEFGALYVQVGVYEAFSFSHEERHSDPEFPTSMTQYERNFIPAVAFGGRFSSF
jgi:hypothetical protein